MTKILAIQGSDLKRVNLKTDTTILLATEAQKRGYKIFYFEPENLSFLNGKVVALCKHIKILNSQKKFYSLLKTINFNLEKSKVILIRNDPPFDNRYLYTTFLLNHISKKVKIINNPSAVRNVSEKLFSINFIILLELNVFIKITLLPLKPLIGFATTALCFLKKLLISERFSLIKVGGIYLIRLMENNFSDMFLTAKG